MIGREPHPLADEAKPPDFNRPYSYRESAKPKRPTSANRHVILRSGQFQPPDDQNRPSNSPLDRSAASILEPVELTWIQFCFSNGALVQQDFDTTTHGLMGKIAECDGRTVPSRLKRNSRVIELVE